MAVFCKASRCRSKRARLRLSTSERPQVLGNQYVAYEAHSSDSASLGSAIATYASRVSAERACVASAACIGYKFDRTLTGDRWATFAAGRMEGAVGKIRVVGESLTPWITDSIPLPGRR